MNAKNPKSQHAMCPMATMCGGIIENSIVLFIPGAALILGGILILMEPKALVWLMAAASILLGIGIFAMAGFIRKLGT